jgi:hypothetical protein
LRIPCAWHPGNNTAIKAKKWHHHISNNIVELTIKSGKIDTRKISFHNIPDKDHAEIHICTITV